MAALGRAGRARALSLSPPTVRGCVRVPPRARAPDKCESSTLPSLALVANSVRVCVRAGTADYPLIL